jgi:hypothetical protein
MGTHSDNLVEFERAHLAPVDLGAGPFWVDHYGKVAVENLQGKGLKEGRSERRRSGGGEYM